MFVRLSTVAIVMVAGLIAAVQSAPIPAPGGCVFIGGLFKAQPCGTNPPAAAMPTPTKVRRATAV